MAVATARRWTHPFDWVLPAVSTLLALSGCGGDSLVLPQDAAPATLVILGGDRQIDTVGRVLGDSLVVRVTDPGNRPIMHQMVRFLDPLGTTGARAFPDTVRTDADGRARVRWMLGTVAGPQLLRARVVAPGGELTAEFHAAALTAAPDTIVATSGDFQVGVVGRDLAQPLVATVTDRFGNPVGGVPTTWNVVGGGSVSPSAAVSDTAGQVKVGRTLGSTPGTLQTTVTAPGLRGSPIVFSQTANPGQPARLFVEAGNGQSGLPGQPLASPLVVRLVDALGNGLASQPVAWPVATGGGTITLPAAGSTTDTGGRASASWTLGPVAGVNIVIPSSGGFTATVTASSSPSQPATIAANSPIQLNGTVGGPVSPPPSVRIADTQGRPVAGVVVSFAVTSGGGSVAPLTVTTDSNGLATVALWTLGQQPGSNGLSASATGTGGALSGSPVRFAAGAVAGPASRLNIVIQPSAIGVSGVPLARPPTVQLEDANGNAVGGSGIVITATITGSPPGASLSAASATTNASGSATLTGLTLLAPAATYTLLLTSSPPLVGAVSSGIDLSSPAGTQLALSTQPSPTVASGQRFPQQPVLQLLDSGGNPVGQSGVVCSVTLASGSPGLGGTLSATTNAAGVAAFTDLSITGVPGRRTLQFSAAGLGPVTSGAIDVQGSGLPWTVGILVQPSSSVANGTTFPIQPAVQVLDQNGVPVSGASVSAAVASGGGTLGGLVTIAADALGMASFTSLSLTGTVGSYSLRLSAGPAATITRTVILTPGPASASRSTATVPSQGKTRRPTVITVQTRDQSGNDLTAGGHSIEIVVTGKNHVGPFFATDNGDGSYTASYTPTKRGNDTIAITLDGTPLAGSPYPSDVQ